MSARKACCTTDPSIGATKRMASPGLQMRRGRCALATEKGRGLDVATISPLSSVSSSWRRVRTGGWLRVWEGGGGGTSLQQAYSAAGGWQDNRDAHVLSAGAAAKHCHRSDWVMICFVECCDVQGVVALVRFPNKHGPHVHRSIKKCGRGACQRGIYARDYRVCAGHEAVRHDHLQHGYRLRAR